MHVQRKKCLISFVQYRSERAKKFITGESWEDILLHGAFSRGDRILHNTHTHNHTQPHTAPHSPTQTAYVHMCAHTRTHIA